MSGQRGSEVGLIKASMAGDAGAFGVLVEQYQNYVCAITFSATSDVHVSEELAQQVFIKAWQHLKQLKNIGRFRAWLGVITQNVVRGWIRKQKRDVIKQAESLDNVGEIAGGIDGGGDSMQKERMAVLRDALAQLPTAYREVMVLFYRQDKSVKQVAEQLELSAEAVKQRLTRGRAMMRENVAAMMEETLVATKPGRAFTAGVVGAIGAGILAGSESAQAGTHAGGAVSKVASVMSTAAVKVALVAVVAVVVTIAVVSSSGGEKGGAGDIETQEVSTAEESVLAVTKEADALPSSVRVEAESENLTGKKSRNLTPVAVNKITSEVAGAADVNDVYIFKPRGVLSGLVRDVDSNEPVTDARVRISGGALSRGYNAKTDSNGFYYFESKEKAKISGDCKVWLCSREYVGIDRNSDDVLNLNLREDRQMVRHFDLEKACMIEVEVVDVNDEPVKGVQLYATRLNDPRYRSVGDDYYSRETDENGLFTLGGFKACEEEYFITAMHRGSRKIEKKGRKVSESFCDYAPAGVAVRLNDPDVIEYARITLHEGADVEGYVFYADGVAADDIEISARPECWRSHDFVDSFEVDESGWFFLQHILPGTYKIYVNIPSENGGSTGHFLKNVILPLDNNEPLVLNLSEKSPESLAAISGRVIFSGDKEPRNVMIYARKGDISRSADLRYDWYTKTFSKEFTLDRLEPGKYTVRFSGDIESKTIEVEAPCDGLVVELDSFSKPVVRGVVQDSRTKEPVGKFRVRAKKVMALAGSNYTQNNQWHEYENEKGDFEFELVGPGVHEFQVVAEGYAAKWSQQVNTEEDGDIVIELDQASSISGLVLDSEGVGITGAKVIPLSLACGNTSRNAGKFISEAGAVVTVDGAFTLKDISAGRESLKVVHWDYSPAVIEDIEVGEGAAVDGLRIVLRKGGVVEGYVYDVNGNGIAGQSLQFNDEAHHDSFYPANLASVVTDSNGYYRVESLPEKVCYVSRADEWQTIGVTRRVIIPRNGKSVRLDFGGDFFVTGQLIDDGNAVEVERLQLQSTVDAYGFRCNGQIDAEGNFIFHGVPKGRYDFYCKVVTGNYRSNAKVNVADADVDMGIIDIGGGNLFVTLKWAGREPKTKAGQVALMDMANGKMDMAGIGRFDDEKKCWKFANVEAGSYTLIAMRADNVQIRADIEVVAGIPNIEVKMPEISAGVHGKIAGVTGAVYMKSEDEIIFATINTSSDGTYEISEIPAGTYNVGYDVQMRNSLVTFELVGGEDAKIDIDLSGVEAEKMGLLMVRAVGEDGMVKSDADITVEAGGVEIEPYMSRNMYFVPAGECVVRYGAEGYKSGVKKVFVKERGVATDTKEVLILLEKAAK
jgi:RNA polymerase sigma factor (sigma-70 family)